MCDGKLVRASSKGDAACCIAAPRKLSRPPCKGESGELTSSFKVQLVAPSYLEDPRLADPSRKVTDPLAARFRTRL